MIKFLAGGKEDTEWLTNHQSFLVMGLTILVGFSGDAFAGTPPVAVPEPATLTFLAIGFGGAAAVKYFKRK